MEVRGEFIVSDLSDKGSSNKLLRRMPWELTAGEMLEAAINQESDGVPRIMISGFSKVTKQLRLFMCFSKFGTITYLLVKDNQHAVIEFDKSDVVERIIRLGNLKVEGANVKVLKLKKFLHTDPEQLTFFLDEELNEAMSSSESLNQLVTDMVAECDASLQEMEPHTGIVCRELENLLKIEYPLGRAYPFGSRIAKSNLKTCDLDLFFDIGDMYEGNQSQSKQDQDNIVRIVHRLVARHPDFKYAEAVPRARTPILRFLHVPTGTRCDVAFRHGLGNENTKLLIFLMSLDDRIRPMLLFLKEWSTKHGVRAILQKGVFSSYALAMLLVFYLQNLTQPILPSIAHMQALNTGRKTVIAGWECSFCQDKSQLKPTSNKQTIQQLLVGFFEMYSKFDYEHLVVCPLLGQAVERASFGGNLACLQPAMSRYVGQLRKNRVERFRTKCAVCVQDPFDLSHNLTRSVKDTCLMAFISKCGLSKTACSLQS